MDEDDQQEKVERDQYLDMLEAYVEVERRNETTKAECDAPTESIIKQLIRKNSSVVVIEQEDGHLHSLVAEPDGSIAADLNGNTISQLRVVRRTVTLHGDLMYGRHTTIIDETSKILELLNSPTFQETKSLPGAIISRETLLPQYPGHVPMHNRESGAISGFEIEGTFYPRFRQYIYTPSRDALDEELTAERATLLVQQKKC